MVEFPDRDDVMVQRLLARKREGAHADYKRIDFERALGSRFEIARIGSSSRRERATLYHAVPR